MGLLPNLDDPNRNIVREAWNRLHPLPGGKLLFSKFLGRTAPYTGTIDAHVEDLGRGFSRVTMRDRAGLRNHLRSVHAIALANLAELTGNVALAYSIPDNARFIVAGMRLDYIKKARGTITGYGETPEIRTNERKEYEVHVSLRDAAGDEVVHAVLQTLVGPKKGG
ncbi:MAG: hotdog fold domain-containing protein [Polyangiales bacterium]